MMVEVCGWHERTFS